MVEVGNVSEEAVLILDATGWDNDWINRQSYKSYK